MTPEYVISVGREAMQVAFLLAAPPLITALVVGLVISIFQAVTQIQEMTLAIIPKMVGVLLALMITFPWLLSTITTFTANIFNSIPNVVR